MENLPKAAVIGTGFIGPVHVEGLRRAGVTVVGILGSHRANSEQAAKALGIARAYGSLDELLADRDVDVVHVASPNRCHFEQASAALRAGKHVVCEKPLAMNSQETRALVELARQVDRQAGVNYNIRYYPLCQEAAERVRRGDVGLIYHVAGSYVQDWLLYASDYNWRVRADEGGPLRAVADIGTHWLDLVQFVMHDEVVAVQADLHCVHATRMRPSGGSQTFREADVAPAAASSSEPVAIDTEDFGCLQLRFRSGAHGVVWVSQVTAGRKNCLRFELAGGQEALSWESERPNELWIGHRDRPNEVLTRDPALLSVAARQFANYPGGHNEGFPDTFKQLFRAFYATLSRSPSITATNYPTFADGHREVVICEAVLRSHAERRWVDVETDDVQV